MEYDKGMDDVGAAWRVTLAALIQIDHLLSLQPRDRGSARELPSRLSVSPTRSLAPEEDELSMARPISTRAHGALDDVTAGALLAAPRVLGWT
jgi:hypothetical protein